MFSFWSTGSTKKKKGSEIPEKISDFQKKLTQENMGMVDKRSQLEMLLQSKGKVALKTPTAQRLVMQMKRHYDMIKMYQTSLQALETTLQNLEMQKVTTEVQQLIGRAPSANLNKVEDNLEVMIEREDEMFELSHMMAQHSVYSEDNDDFLSELGINIPDDGKKPKPDATPVLTVVNSPSPPSYLEKISLSNDGAEIAQNVAEKQSEKKPHAVTHAF